MTNEERVAEKALLTAMMVGIDLAHDLEGHIHLKFTICPYCETQLSDFEAAKAHDATCEKHPAVIRLAARELDIERAIEFLEGGYDGAALNALKKPEAPDAG